jgi:hypothetical protein
MMADIGSIGGSTLFMTNFGTFGANPKTQRNKLA